MYAKDKEITQVEKINESLVNKLEYKIINPRINCRNLKDSNGEKLGIIDYTKLVNNPNIECKVGFYKNGTIDETITDPMIVKYCELNKEYHFKINMECADMPRDSITNTQMKHDLFFKKVANEIRSELSKFGYTNSEIADILVKFLYNVKPSKHKAVLWFCYGEYIVKNLIKNGCKSSTKTIQCVDCGEWLEVNTKDNESCRCSECVKEHKRELKRLKMQRYRERKRSL